MEVHQILPYLNHGDAIGDHAIHIRKTIQSLGYMSHIYVEGCNQKVADQCDHYEDHRKRSSRDNILIYHHGIGGTKVFNYFMKAADRKILIYHNITPPHFFEGFNDALLRQAEQGRSELWIMKDTVDIALGDSEYNRRELEECGYTRTMVMPIPIYLEKFASIRPNEAVLRFYDDDYTNILFVGRIAPNKRQDELIRIFSHYQRRINPESRLFLVGSYAGMEKYCNYLLQVINESRCWNVVLTGHTALNEMVAYYRIAHLFLSMSEHEGFCVPLLESMYFNVPIMAFNSTVIPYTLGDSGVLFDSKEVGSVAESVDKLMKNPALRDRVLQRQQQRLDFFKKDRTAEIIDHSIREITQSCCPVLT